ncbi:MAG: aminoacetone oxidase family FAD-binding enzyme, partial [Cytophagales bacterium]
EAFKIFQAKDTFEWFENRGVKLKIEEDGRIFPISDNSQSIIDCFIDLTYEHGIQLKLNYSIEKITKTAFGFDLKFTNNEIVQANKVIIATGGYNNMSSYQFLVDLGHTIHAPIPSLFTFNDSQKQLVDLSGLSVSNAIVKIASSKFENQGPLLITHWGLSGPAVIKLSAWAAEYLAGQNYVFTALVNWTGIPKEDELKAQLADYKIIHPKKKIVTNQLFGIPLRLWGKICEMAEINEERIWAEISAKQFNKLVENLFRCAFQIKGKTTFKDEFVTCGGVDLKEINVQTMESKLVKDLFFAGEVLHIDGITGGFNFQSAWTTGFIAGKNIHI